MSLILASGSPRRRELIALITRDFIVLPSSVEESRITADTPALLEAAYANSLNVFTAWGGSRLVGVLRAVGDGASIVYLQDLLVLDSYRRQGIGSALLAQALEQYATVYQVVLLTDSTPSTRAFYGQAGLTEAEQLGCTAFVRFAKPNQI